MQKLLLINHTPLRQRHLSMYPQRILVTYELSPNTQGTNTQG